MDTNLENAKRLQALIRPKDEGTRLLRELGNLIYEFLNPSFSTDDALAVNDLKNRLTLVCEEVLKYAKPFFADPRIRADINSINNAKSLGDQISGYDLLLQHARGLHDENEEQKKPQIMILSGIISYNPRNNEVFYDGISASKPRANSKERAIWRHLYECKDVPRRVLFSKLQSEMDNKNQRMFTRLDETITSDIDKWNKKFQIFGVKVLRKDGDSILLEEKPIRKK